MSRGRPGHDYSGPVPAGVWHRGHRQHRGAAVVAAATKE